MKATLQDLAIFGGTPAFAEVLHVGRPNIGDRERLLERIHDLLDRRWLTNNGPYVLEFEQQLCRLTGAPHCIVTCNGTVALEIAIRAAGLSQEVIVPAFTFVATAHALQWQGITPVFCDVDPSTHNLDPDGRRARDHAAHHRHPRGAPVGPAVPGGRAGRDRAAPRAQAALRCGARPRMHPPGTDDRRVRRRGGVQLSRDQVREQLRGRARS